MCGINKAPPIVSYMFSTMGGAFISDLWITSKAPQTAHFNHARPGWSPHGMDSPTNGKEEMELYRNRMDTSKGSQTDPRRTIFIHAWHG